MPRFFRACILVRLFFVFFTGFSVAVFVPTLLLFIFVIKSVGTTALSNCTQAPRGGGNSVRSVSRGTVVDCKADAPRYFFRRPTRPGWRRREISRLIGLSSLACVTGASVSIG